MFPESTTVILRPVSIEYMTWFEPKLSVLCYSACSAVFFDPRRLNFSLAVKIFSVANSREAMYMTTKVNAAT